MAKAKAVDTMIKIEVEQGVLPYVGMVRVLYKAQKKYLEKHKEYSNTRDAYFLAQSALEDFIYNTGADNGIEE